MRTEHLWRSIALGAAAGLAGSVVVEAFRLVDMKWLPESEPPIREDPGKFMINQAKKALPEPAQPRLSPAIENLLSKVLAAGYGMTFGALYGATCGKANRLVTEGVVLGLATWAVGYLGWLPATGLMPPIRTHTPKQVAAPIAEHAFYGLTTVAGYRWLQHRVRARALV